MEMLLFESEAQCFSCNGKLLRLEKPYHTWTHYCLRCKHLTAPADYLKKRLEEAVAKGALGVVTAVPFEIELKPGPEPELKP